MGRDHACSDRPEPASEGGNELGIVSQLTHIHAAGARIRLQQLPPADDRHTPSRECAACCTGLAPTDSLLVEHRPRVLRHQRDALDVLREHEAILLIDRP